MRMRAGAGATTGDDAFPGPRWEAPSIEVTAEFTSLYKSLMGFSARKAKRKAAKHYQSTNQHARPVRLLARNVRSVGEIVEIANPTPINSSALRSPAAGHQFVDRFARIFTLLQDGM